MRNWAKWCVNHNLRYILYLVAIINAVVISPIVMWSGGLKELYEDVVSAFESIQKEWKE